MQKKTNTKVGRTITLPLKKKGGMELSESSDITFDQSCTQASDDEEYSYDSDDAEIDNRFATYLFQAYHEGRRRSISSCLPNEAIKTKVASDGKLGSVRKPVFRSQIGSINQLCKEKLAPEKIQKKLRRASMPMMHVLEKLSNPLSSTRPIKRTTLTGGKDELQAPANENKEHQELSINKARHPESEATEKVEKEAIPMSEFQAYASGLSPPFSKSRTRHVSLRNVQQQHHQPSLSRAGSPFSSKRQARRSSMSNIPTSTPLSSLTREDGAAYLLGDRRQPASPQNIPTISNCVSATNLGGKMKPKFVRCNRRLSMSNVDQRNPLTSLTSSEISAAGHQLRRASMDTMQQTPGVALTKRDATFTPPRSQLSISSQQESLLLAERTFTQQCSAGSVSSKPQFSSLERGRGHPRRPNSNQQSRRASMGDIPLTLFARKENQHLRLGETPAAKMWKGGAPPRMASDCVARDISRLCRHGVLCRSPNPWTEESQADLARYFI